MTLLSILFDFICLANSSTKTCIPANVINEALEHVVDSIEPKMRYFPGYKKILNKGVATSLAYISNLVDTIPGPLFISSRTFTTDPQVNAYFATVADTQAVFSNSTELRDFFEAQENAALEDVYALLCMDVEEKTVMGMDLHKDIIRRDAMQTALSFSEHKILSPATNEADVRKGIKQCIF